MRLLNVYTFKLDEFERKTVPPYAIASHRWCENEATYVDVLEGKNKDGEGYKKVVGFCNYVQRRNERLDQRHHTIQKIEWIWIDTCCIDRRSSAEIAENITSMYKYYEQSVACYAYLADVPESNGIMDWNAVSKSQWFKRGWTLQELVAPNFVLFLTTTWSEIGHKCNMKHHSRLHRAVSAGYFRGQCPGGGLVLNSFLSRTTGIGRQILEKRRDPKTLPADDICTWIEKRETKKEEDLAYCLLGLFGVFMVPNYGEGENAWSRLEDEVNKKRKREGLKEVSLPRPTQLQPDEERYEPSIFSEVEVYSDPNEHEYGRLPSSSLKQHYQIPPSLSLDPQYRRPLRPSLDRPLTPDSEPDDCLHWKDELPTGDVRNGSRRRRTSFDSSERDRQPFRQLTSERPLRDRRGRQTHRYFMEDFEVEPTQNRREEEELRQRIQEEEEKKKKSCKEIYESGLVRKQRDEEELKPKFEEEKELQRTKMKHQGLTDAQLQIQEAQELGFTRPYAEDRENFRYAERQPRPRSTSGNSRERVILHQPTSSPDQTTDARTSSAQLILGALNQLRLLQPWTSQASNGKTEGQDAHNTSNASLVGTMSVRKTASSPDYYSTITERYLADGTVVRRETGYRNGKQTNSTTCTRPDDRNTTTRSQLLV